MDLRAVREVNTGFGDGLAAAFEMIATPVIFGCFGWLLDNRFGTSPWLTIVFGLFVFGYEVWKLVMRYTADMAGHARTASWARPNRKCPQRGTIDA